MCSPRHSLQITVVSTIPHAHTDQLYSCVFTANFKDSEEIVDLEVDPFQLFCTLLMYDTVYFKLFGNQIAVVFYFICICVCSVVNNKGFILCTEHPDIFVYAHDDDDDQPYIEQLQKWTIVFTS